MRGQKFGIPEFRSLIFAASDVPSENLIENEGRFPIRPRTRKKKNNERNHLTKTSGGDI